MEETAFDFATEIKEDGAQEFSFITESESQWNILQIWYGKYNPPYCTTEIRKGTPSVYQDYYVDVDVHISDDKLVFRDSQKYEWNKIEIRLPFDKIMARVTDTDQQTLVNPVLTLQRLTGLTLKYEIKLSPILQLEEDNKYVVERDASMENILALTRELGNLLTDKSYEFLFDVVIKSGTTSVKAHKSILYARLPEIGQRLCMITGSHSDGQLDVVDVGPSAAPGLSDMVKFLYTNDHPKDLVSLGNLAIAAKAMGSENLKSIFMDAFMECITPENVLYAIFFTDLHKMTKSRKIAMRFLLHQFNEVKATSSWNNLQVIFTCFILGTDDLGLSDEIPMLQVLKYSLRVCSKVYSK